MRFAWNNASNPPPRSSANRAGFTFAEVLAAMVFLAVLVPVVIEGLTLSNRAAVVAERKTVATELAAAKLNEIVLLQTWSGSQPSGDFGLEWPGFRWELRSATWPLDALTELTLVVRYEVQGREYAVLLATLVDPTSP